MAAEPIPIMSEERAAYRARSLPAMTGAANEVNRLLKKLDTGPKANRFLRHLEDLTFGQAGFHQQWGHEDPGTWCWFDLSAWAHELELSSSAVIHKRDRLVAQRIIWYEPELETPGRGRIGWNLNFATWRPLQSDEPHWGGKRRGAGRPKKTTTTPPPTPEQPGIDILKSKQDAIDFLNNAQRPSIDILNAQRGGVDILNNFGDFKISTDARSGAAPRLGLLDLLRKDTLRRDPDIQIETNVSTADGAATPPLGGVASASLDDGMSETPPTPPSEGDPSCSRGIYEIPATGQGKSAGRSDTTPSQRSGRTPTPETPRPPSPRGAASGAIGQPNDAETKPRGKDRYLPGEEAYRIALKTQWYKRLGAKPLHELKEWRDMAWWFRTAPGAPVPVAEVIAFYDGVKRRPFWRGKFLSIATLGNLYIEFARDRKQFQQDTEDEIAGRKFAREVRAGKPTHPHPADAANTSVASTPDTIPVLDIAAENRRKLAEYEAGRRPTTTGASSAASPNSAASATQARLRQLAQRAGRGTGAGTTPEGPEGGDPTW